MAANSKKMQVDTGFPLLSIEELQNCLVALGISVANDDIAKPTPQTAQMIYSQLVEILMGAPMSAVEGVKSSLLGMLEHKVSQVACAVHE
jgi:kinetochore protein Nuf2